jgi:GTP-binding protein
VKIDSVRFERAAFRPEDAPRATGPDVIFVGRSNVGKSSLINRLVGRSDLARVSSTPGRTQSVNFVRVNESFHLVDMPGYGWARVPEEVRRSWKQLVDGVLARRRERIALALLVIDARHPPSPLDRTMQAWLVENGLPFVVVATKADKISTGARPSGPGRTSASSSR